MRDLEGLPRKRKEVRASHEIHRRRCLIIRSAGPHAAEFLHRLREGPWVFGPQLRELSDLVREHGADSVDQACRRALFFGAVDGAQVVKRILLRALERLPFLETGLVARSHEDRNDYGRALEEYASLLAIEGVAQ